MLEFVSRSPRQTRRLGARLGALLQGGDVICMEGPLGAGKTCLAQGLGRGCGIAEPLTSPTFVLVRQYTRPGDSQTLYHVDWYRISGEDAVFSLGVDEFMGDPHAIFIIEWAERARSLVPFDHLWIRFDFANHADEIRRVLYFTAQGERHIELLRQFRRSAFGA